MDRNLRRSALQHLIKTSGLVTDMVSGALGIKPDSVDTKTDSTPGAFKEQFLRMTPGPEREALVLNTIISRKITPRMVPITVDGPNGIKLTYQVMSDYITIDGLRVPMAGVTAQKVADRLGMKLPTSKMSKQIWDAADTRIRPSPLSAGGEIGGKHYTGDEVVQHKISDSDSSVSYNNMIDQELKNHPGANLVAGHMKDIVQPEGDPNKLGLYGWQGTDGKPIQNSAQTPHDTHVHTEYGAGVRLVGNQVTLTTPAGRTITTTMDKIMSNPDFSKALSNTQGIKRYNLGK